MSLNSETLPDASCACCGATARIKCVECSEYFCNNTTDEISHAVFHLVKQRHRVVLIDNLPIKCASCSETNVFRLGWKKTEAASSETESSTGSNDSSSLSAILPKVFCMACQDNPGLISGKVLSLVPSSLCSKNLTTTKQEQPNLPKIKLKFDAQRYIDTFIPLITAESLKEKEIKESMRQENVTIRLSGSFCHFYFRRLNNDLKINIGDEIRFSHKSGLAFSGFISEDQFSEELKVEIDLSTVETGDEKGTNGAAVTLSGNGARGNKDETGTTTGTPVGVDPLTLINNHTKTGYTIEYVWRAVCYERMCWALKKLYKDRKKNEIFKYILKGRKEKKENIDILQPPTFCPLNESQEIAVKAALTRTLTLVQGPPGTGKTMVSAVIVYNVVKLLKKKVLVVAPSNTAVDQLALKINNAGLKVLRIMSRRKESGSNETDFLCLHNLLREFEDPESAKHELIKSADVVCCTCVTAGQKLFNRYTFPFVLIDEAVQSTEPLTLIPCVYGATNLVLVGDHRQLGPTILNKDVVKAGFKQSLFERLLRIGVPPYLLSIQYRMHPDLCQFPSEYFYGGLLKTGASATKCLNFPSNFFYVSNGREEISQSGTSFINRAEAVLVENIIRYLFKNGVLEQQIGVITPYEGQRSYILSKIFGNEPGNLEISNVDGFQGREKDFIIVSLVRSNTYQGIGFVADRRRMNVTLTRAKHGLAIVGNPFTLYKNDMWANLLDWYDNRGAIYEGPIGALKRMNLKTFDMKGLIEKL
ncbi:regulator of nonsense transcripts 1 [Pancytospora epiphaga]|nr:regulator of nonsense transcripts 1 [Pancytospora epiphaga]